MSWLVALLILSVISLLSAVVWFMVGAPKTPSPEAKENSDFPYPTAAHNRPQPKSYGDCRRAPNILWKGDLHRWRLRKDGNTIGHGYSMGLLYSLGGPIQEILQFRLDEKITAKPGATKDFIAKTGIRAEGVRYTKNDNGRVRWTDGSQTSMPWQYIIDQTGLQTAYVGQSLVMMEGGPLDAVDETAGDNILYRNFSGDNIATLPPHIFIVRNIPRILQPLAATNFSEIENPEYSDRKDMNPADIIFDLLTDELKIPVERFDLDIWNEVQETLYSEGLGISISLSEDKTCKQYVEDILQHVDGHLIVSRTTGKIILKLNRYDYDENSLDEIDENDYSDFKMIMPTYENVYNSVSIKWLSRKNFQDQDSYIAINPVSINFLGHRKQQTITYQYCTTSAVASQLVKRTAKKLFYPYYQVEFKLPISVLPDLEPGDVIKIKNTWAGLDEIFRILEINVDTDRKNEYRIKAVEDTLRHIDDWDEVDIPEPAEPEYKQLDYAPRHAKCYPVTREMDGLFIPVAVKPQTGSTTQYRVSATIAGTGAWLAAGRRESYGDFGYCGYGELEAAYDDISPMEIDKTNDGFIVKNCIDVKAVTNSDSEWQSGNTMAIIDRTENSFYPTYELISIKKITSLGSGRYRCTGILRQLLNTEQNDHAINAKIYFLPKALSTSLPIDTVQVTPETKTIRWDINPNVYFTAFNSDFESPEASYNFKDYFRRNNLYPHPVQRLIGFRSDETGQEDDSGDYVTMFWLPRFRRGGATWIEDPFQDPGADDFYRLTTSATGVFHPLQNYRDQSSTSYTRSIPSYQHTWTVKQINNTSVGNFVSGEKVVTIAAKA